MIEISEGQIWYPNIDYHGWGAVYVNEKLKNDRWAVDIVTDPMTRDIVMTSEQIYKGYYHKI
jgi:hypothetical protein